MELKRRLSPKTIFAGVYVVLLAIYIIVGLQPADAAQYEVAAELAIPAIGLETDVAELDLVNGELATPDTIAGSYAREENKTLLIGHSTTVFENLDAVRLGDEIVYDGKTYRVVAIDQVRKSEIRMSQVMAGAEKDTIIIMTCAGELLPGGDATHRLMIKAVLSE